MKRKPATSVTLAQLFYEAKSNPSFAIGVLIIVFLIWAMMQFSVITLLGVDLVSKMILIALVFGLCCIGLIVFARVQGTSDKPDQ